MAARSAGGLLHPLGIGALEGDAAAAVGAAEAMLGIAEMAAAPTDALGVAGPVVDEATEQPMTSTEMTPSWTSLRFNGVDLAHQPWTAVVSPVSAGPGVCCI